MKLQACAVVLFAMLASSTSRGMEVSMDLGSAEISGTIIFPPGSHMLSIRVHNDDTKPIEEVELIVRASKLHQGQTWNASRYLASLHPEESLVWNFSTPPFEPGLFTLEMLADGDPVYATELRISRTLDPWQPWRARLDLPNESHRLLAFYYPWYGTPEGPSGRWVHWVPERGYDSTHVPIIGFYDSLSTEVIEYHIRVAQSAGIDAFISSWWGPGNYIDNAVPLLLDCAARSGFNISLYLEIAASPESLYEQLRYILTEYGEHPAFLEADGRPVVFIYGRVISELELSDFATVFSRLETEGLGGFYVADKLDAGYLGVFDGIHTYSPLTALGRYPDLVAAARERGGLFAATLAPGYDDTVIRDPGMVVDRAGGTFYQESWEMIMLSKPEWVLITSFNEWHEGSEVEPSLESGDLYLNLTELYYGLFEAGRLTSRWESRIEEITSLFAQAESIISRSEAEGQDTRIMKRDYGIAGSVWRNFEYETARMYLLRIVEREDVDEKALVIALFPAMIVRSLLVARASSTYRRMRRDHHQHG